MSKGQTLRALVTERLCAAADEIFALFERTITEYEEEIHQYKAENQRKQMLLDSATAIPSSVSVLSEIHHKNHSLKQETSQGNEEETDQLRKLLSRVKTEPSIQLPTESKEERHGQDIRAETSLHCQSDLGQTSDSPCFYKDREHAQRYASDSPFAEDNVESWRAPISCSVEAEAMEDHREQADFLNQKHAQYKLADNYTIGKQVHYCLFCQKPFTSSRALQIHIRIHTGDKPYSCPVCKKRFSDNSNLLAHKRIHTLERPYSCSVCMKRFSQSSNLRRHMRVHTGEKPFTCSICKRNLVSKQSLNIHMESHAKQIQVCN
ncbi:unnamed protein product [Knipowitschia caucasica]